MLVKLKNYQPRILGLVTGHRLMPTRGKVQEFEMTPEQYETLQSDPTFQSWKKLRMIGEVKGSVAQERFEKPEEPEAAGALDDVNVSQAQALISATTDMDLLTAWHSKDSRKTVKKAIESRMADLEAPADDDFDEEFGSAEDLEDLE